MKRTRKICRTAREAEARGAESLENFQISGLRRSARSNAIEFSKRNAKPGDIAWIGPCEDTGTRIVCYYDANMDPSDCKNERC
jgi:hypothetical protein